MALSVETYALCKKKIPTSTSQLINDSNFTTDNPVFSEAATRENIESEETYSTILGKTEKYFSDIENNFFNMVGQPEDRTDPNNPIPGIATLNENGYVPTSQLPSYVDDVLEGYLNKNGTFYEHKTINGYTVVTPIGTENPKNEWWYEKSGNDYFRTTDTVVVSGKTYYTENATYTDPYTPESDKVYIDFTTNLTYRWGGSSYVTIGTDLALGETSGTAYRGDRGKAAYNHATAKGSAFTSGFYKVTTNAEGHVTAATPVVKKDITDLGVPASDTTYSFTSGTNKFTVTPSSGSAFDVTVTPSIANNITGSGTNGYIAKFNGGNSITNGPAFGSDTSKYLRNDGSWVKPPNDNTTYSIATGDSNGQIKVTPSSGSAYNVNVKGLNSAAYQSFSAGSGINFGTSDNKNFVISANFGNSAGTICQGNDSRLSDSRPASDVYSWAKASSKPSYTYSEVGAASSGHNHNGTYYPMSGGNLNNGAIIYTVNNNNRRVKIADSICFLPSNGSETNVPYLINSRSNADVCLLDINSDQVKFLQINQGGASTKELLTVFGNTNAAPYGTTFLSAYRNYMNLCATDYIQCRNTGDTSFININAANVSSSRRFKENIQTMTEEEAKKILNIRPVTFDFKEQYASKERERYHQPGVIAEEVDEIIPSVVRYDNYDLPESEPVPTFVEYSHFTPYLIKMIQIQQQEIEELKRRL